MKYNPHAPDWHKVPPDDITLPEYAKAWIDMEPHVPTLSALAGDAHSPGKHVEKADYCSTIIEFGVRGAVSTWALLEGMCTKGRLIGVDIEDVTSKLPKAVRDDPHFELVIGDSVKVDLPNADLVMIDSSHEFTQTVCELRRAEELGAKTIVLHDYLYEPCKGTVQKAVDGFVGEGYLTEPKYRLAYVEPSKWGLAVLVLR